MVVGIAKLNLRVYDSNSLKGKRRVIKSLIGQIKNRFDVAVSEVGLHDVWQNAEIGISAVGNDQPLLNSVLSNVFNFIDSVYLVEIVTTDIEFIHMGR
jgi:uncharacterized protein YlxP (DUF503 family)